jgi:membrane-bound metal-dependent hydrolase YbcI (DUF457 family)
MDPLTHGLAGALIAKAFFAPKPQPLAGPHVASPVSNRPSAVATWVVTLGAVFPDADFVFNLFSRSRVATLEYHRWITHSVVCLPAFALGLAAVTWWWVRWRGDGASRRESTARRDEERHARQSLALGKAGAEPPHSTGAGITFWALAGMYAAGIGSHILLDAITSWGTQAWAPLSRARVNWDWVFILDGALTAMLLLPLIAAWLLRHPHQAVTQATLCWAAMTLSLAALRLAATVIGAPFSWRQVWAGSALLGGVLFMAARISRAPAGTENSRAELLSSLERRWCRAGCFAAGAYLALCAAAHEVALARVRQAVTAKGWAAENVGALPLPPFATRWGGLVRTPDGVHLALFNLLDDAPLEFAFNADSAPPELLARARQLPEVQTYFWFARFPVMRLNDAAGHRTLVFNDLRFVRRWSSAPALFEYHVIFDPAGQVLDHGWAASLARD